nr:MAG TPA: hypothetical protein [Caudoviricetes sp.]
MYLWYNDIVKESEANHWLECYFLTLFVNIGQSTRVDYATLTVG